MYIALESLPPSYMLSPLNSPLRTESGRSWDPQNILVHDGDGVVAGHMQHGYTTAAMLYRWLNVVLDIQKPWSLISSVVGSSVYHGQEHSIIPDGVYTIVNSNTLTPLHAPKRLDMKLILRVPYKSIDFDAGIKNEQEVPLASYGALSESEDSFRRAVFDRDHERPCLESDDSDISMTDEMYYVKEVVHIFPPGDMESWLSPSFEQCVPNFVSDDTESHVRALNALNNGMTVRPIQRMLIESYQLGVDDDDHYKLVNFSDFYEASGLSWQSKDDISSDDRPSDILLRSHFHQCLLRHVLSPRGSEEASYERMIHAFVQEGGEDYNVDLEHPRWTLGPGKRLLENYLFDRLFPYLPCIETPPGAQAPRSRFPADRFYAKEILLSVDEQSDWLETFFMDELSSTNDFFLRFISLQQPKQSEAAVYGIRGTPPSVVHSKTASSYVPSAIGSPPKYILPGCTPPLCYSIQGPAPLPLM